MRLVDADAAVKLLRSLGSRDYRREKGTINDAIKMLLHPTYTPTVDAAPVVYGEFVGVQYDGFADGCPVYDLWECSNCREEFEAEGYPPIFNYCPNCGAKMDGGSDHVE